MNPQPQRNCYSGWEWKSIYSHISSMAKTSGLWVGTGIPSVHNDGHVPWSSQPSLHCPHTHARWKFFPLRAAGSADSHTKVNLKLRQAQASRNTQWLVNSDACWIKKLKRLRIVSSSWPHFRQILMYFFPGCTDTKPLFWSGLWLDTLPVSMLQLFTELSSCWPHCSKQQHFYWLHLWKIREWKECITDVEHQTQFSTVL